VVVPVQVTAVLLTGEVGEQMACARSVAAKEASAKASIRA